MLVLTRKYQEKVRIGDGITITVLRTKGKAVRLGIEAPIDVPVIRGELAFDEPPTDDKEDAANSNDSALNDRRGKGQSRQAIGPTAWSTESHPHPAGRTRDSQATPQVTLQRLPREKAAEILPQLLSGHGPLRDMLNERSRLE